MQDLTITLIQSYLHWEDKEKNLQQFTSYIKSINEPTDLIILPEMFSTGFAVYPELLAEPEGGETFKWMQRAAAEKKAVITGTFITKVNGRFYNRLYWVRPDGTHDYYDKRHLFRMAGEDKNYHMGKARLVVELNGWRVCPLICYDLRFPVWSRNRYLQGEHEYDLLIYLANWPMARNHAWKSLLVARAIENQAYVAGVNRIGKDGNGVDHSGDSTVLNPKGNPIVKIAPGKQIIETIEVSADQLWEFRESFKVGLDWDAFKIDLD